MRVVQVCPYSLSVPGGVQNQVLGLARALRRLGVDATVVAPCDDEPPEPGVVGIGKSIPFASNGSVAPIAPDPAAFARTVAVLRAEHPDVVHLHEPISPGAPWAALLRSDAPAVGTFHASGNAPGALYRLARPLVRRLAQRLTVRTAVSDDARRLAERYMGGAYKVLPNAVDVETWSGAEPWPRPPSPVVFFVGRHEERKGLSVLLDAFAQLDHDAVVSGAGLSDAVLWVAGEGPQTEELRARGVPRVEWLGRIDDAELARRMRAATVCCAPSLYGESFGIVLVEAMAASTPVVASDIAGYRDVARNGREALLVPPERPAALRDALARVLTDPALAGDLVAAGRDRAATFSMPALAERYVALYEQARARGRPKR